MIELKEWTASEIEEYDDARLELAEDGKIDCTRVYIKQDVDKVIEELEESHKKEVEQLLMEIVKLKGNYKEACDRLQTANLIKDEQLAATRHHKYKRCLDNAWGCQQRMELFHELVLEEARTIALPNEVALKEYRRKRERAAKWHKRWLKIAEQFKDKEAQ